MEGSKAKELELKKELIRLQDEQEIHKHEMKIEELKFIRETDRLRHEQDLERGRIKTAEIRKSQMRMQHGDAFKY